MPRNGSALVAFAALAFVVSARAADQPPAAMQAEAAAELHAAIDILKAHEVNRAKIDWPTLEQQAFALAHAAQTPAETYPAIWFVIFHLGEKHTHLLTQDQWKGTTTGKQSGSYTPPPFELPQASLIDGKIGLLRIPAFSGPEANDRAYVAVLREALTRFQAAGICRFAVDLRGNDGGNNWTMTNGVRSLLGEGPYGYWDSSNGTMQPLTVPNHPWSEHDPPLPDYAITAPPQLSAPVAVLIDRKSWSAAEDTAIAFEGRPHTRVFGEPSGGYLPGNAGYALPDGARLFVAQAWPADRLGRPYRVAVVPDVETKRGQATLDAAVKWLKAQRCTAHAGS